MSDFQTMNQMLNEVQTISKSYDRIAEATGENFNIFSVLDIESDEVTTHSRFLAELLNPKGTHGQKDIFLKLFANQLKKQLESQNKFTVDIDTTTATVKTEKTINNGRLDIFIEDNNKNAIIIENKIYATEQEDQLLKYREKFPDPEKAQLIYLTLGGEKSENASSANCEPISYKEDVLIWLDECKQKSVDIPILRETISQYINLIKKLTNQNRNITMSEEIANRVLKDEESFDAYNKMVKAKKEVFSSVMEKKVFPTLEKIAADNNLKLLLKREFYSDKPYTGFRFDSENLERNNVRIVFEFQKGKHRECVFGFWKIDKDYHSQDHEKIIEGFDREFKNHESSYKSLCYKKYSKFPNWEKLDVLEKIQFGDFDKDIREKIEKMLSMVVRNETE